MYRLIGYASLMLLAVSAAKAQPVEDCRGPEVVTAFYAEQVCYRGRSSAGYVACRWVDRQHDVAIRPECTPAYTSEEALPAGHAPGPRRAGGYRKD